MNNLHIRKDDSVIVISGKSKGRKGKVIATIPAEGKVIVSGVNKVKRHTKARRQTDPSGIIEKESPIYACKVMRLCPKCDKPTRLAHTFEDGRKTRLCTHCKREI